MRSATLPPEENHHPQPSTGIISVQTAAMADGEICLQTAGMQMGELIRAAHRAAMTSLTVVLTGESGVGKKTLARQMHEWSAWRGHPFVSVDCAALSETMLQGASFAEVLASLATDSVLRGPHPAMIGSSTILLNNIADLCALGQKRLLQFMADHAPGTSAGSCAAGAPFRLMAASERSLAAEVAAHRFHQELFFRINVIGLEIPPLRERPEDILPLAYHILREVSQRSGVCPMRFSPEASAALTLYRWPGNVRELRGAVEHAIAHAHHAPAITLRHLPRAVSAARSNDGRRQLTSLEEMEREHIARVLAQAESLEQAAATLGIHLTTLWRKRRRYHLTSPLAKTNPA